MDLSDWIARRAGFTPDKTAIRFEGEDISYARLSERIGRVSLVLSERLGIGFGDRVAFLGLNSPEFIALFFACARLGAMTMPLNWRLAPPEHHAMLADCTPKALFVEPEYLDQTDAVLTGGWDMARVVVDEDGARSAPPAGWQSYRALLDQTAGEAPHDPRVGHETPVLLCYTSGATGRPKGAMLDQRSVLYNAVHSAHMHDMTSTDVVLTTLPMFHVGGLNIQTLPALHAGATVVLHRKFDAAAVFDALEGDRASLTVLVPTQLHALMEHPRWQTADLSSLRMITTGSTIVPAALMEVVHKRVPLIQVYGSTETSPIAAYNNYRECGRKLGSTGRPAVHCDIRVVDDMGRDQPTGTSGEILVRGPNVMAGYWNAPDINAEVLREGWFHTGDVGHFDEEGDLWVDDRKQDMIISGGENIYPAELENLLAECPLVAEAAVVGRPDAHWGQVVVAVVVPVREHPVTAEEVSGFFKGRLARYKHPRAVVFVDALPRNAMGKIQKNILRQMVVAETGAAPVAAAGATA